jgi:hypothetical protein
MQERPGLEADPYEIALVVYEFRVSQLTQAGELRRPSQITTEEELDNHFDELSRLYRQTCLEMGLAWPPPAFDEE